MAFEKKIAEDAGITKEEARIAFGYLLTRKLAVIISDMGVIPNPSHPDVQRIAELMRTATRPFYSGKNQEQKQKAEP